MPRDLTRAIEHVERAAYRNLDAPTPRPPAPGKPAEPKIRAWHAADGKPAATSHLSKGGALTARSVQVKVTRSPEEVLGLAAPNGQPRVKFILASDGGVLTAEVAAKSVRKTQTTIRAAGAENTFVMLQGKLARNGIAECGLVAQAKTAPTPEAERAPADRMGPQANSDSTATGRAGGSGAINRDISIAFPGCQAIVAASQIEEANMVTPPDFAFRGFCICAIAISGRAPRRQRGGSSGGGSRGDDAGGDGGGGDPYPPPQLRPPNKPGLASLPSRGRGR